MSNMKKPAPKNAAPAPKMPVAAAPAPTVAAPAAAAPALAPAIVAPVAAEAAPVVATSVAAPVLGEVMKPFTDMQEKVRLNTEQGLDQFRTQYASLKGKAESASDKLEVSIQAAQAGSREFNAKMFDLFRAQTNVGFTHFQALFAAKTVADAMKLQQDFVKSQMDSLQAQSQSFAELATKVANDVVEPVKASMVVSFTR